MQTKNEMTSLDIRYAVKELRQFLLGGMIRKIYQYGSSRTMKIFFDIFVPSKGSFWLYINKSKIFITKFKKAAPQEPPSFCMFLRKHLMGKKIREIRQYRFDRIVEMEIGESILIVELFHPGNVILCDSMRNIVMPMEVQKWKDREIRPKIPYKYPPRMKDPFAMDIDNFRLSLSKHGKPLISYIASVLGFGKIYASEICARSGIDCSKPAREALLGDIMKLHNTITSIGNQAIKPAIYDDFVSPFPLVSYGEKKFDTKNSFMEALDEFFSKQEIETVKHEVERGVIEEKEKTERIMQRQDEAEEKWNRIEQESKETGDLIYNYYSIVESAITGIERAREMGLGWEEIKQKLASEATPEAESIKEIREGDGIVVLNIGGKDVEIDITKSVEENAAKYYEESKWARRKLQGLQEARESHFKKLEETKSKEEQIKRTEFKEMVFPSEKKEQKMDSESTDKKEESPDDSVVAFAENVLGNHTTSLHFAEEGQNLEKRERKKWYEKFRWFFSSDGFLVIAGKDAASNEALIKKHTEPNDLVFHADIQGAAFVVVKSNGQEIPDETRKEAAEFAAAHCKAWNKGLGTVDVYSVKPEQLSKSPPSGQSLPKGSFMIYGERVWYRDLELKLAIGVKIDREKSAGNVIAGPVMAMRKNANYFVTIKPGFKKSMELARTVKNKILMRSQPEDRFIIERIPLDEFQALIPAGTGDVAEYV